MQQLQVALNYVQDFACETVANKCNYKCQTWHKVLLKVKYLLDLKFTSGQ